MILKSILLKNYKSIVEVEINLKKVNKSNTFALLGINESGKSSILKAISFIQKKELKYPIDFNDKSKPIEIKFIYKLGDIDEENLLNSLNDAYENMPKQFLKKGNIEPVVVSKEIKNISQLTEIKEYKINYKNKVVKGYKLEGDKIKISKNDEINLDKILDGYFKGFEHKILFWKSEDKYLISNRIDLRQFAANPKGISIPLFNCFSLIGIKENQIQREISSLNNPTSIYNIVQRLNDAVTEHIRKVWKGHPILLKFNINNNIISLLVEDEGVNYDAKVTSQRSDGFRQFISFLLTISIENKSEKLENTILLLDEPEMHLHPTAQINLLKEFLNITSNKDANNIIFYATHSNYLIDKSNLDRSFNVVKFKNTKTIVKTISKTQTSYSEINYEIFDIATNDYHNELYGYIEYIDKTKLTAIPKDRDWVNTKTNRTERVSLPTYIRHSIHHPENTVNRKFTENSLRKSIKLLRKIKTEL